MLISYKLEKAVASMKLNPASISREAALLLLGFRVEERAAQRMGGSFRLSARSISLGRAAWAAEFLTEMFWSQFLPSNRWTIQTLSAQLKPTGHLHLSYALPPLEREQLLEKIYRGQLSVLTTTWLAKTPEGLVVGEFTVGLRVRTQAALGPAVSLE